MYSLRVIGALDPTTVALILKSEVTTTKSHKAETCDDLFVTL
jgi:hypothetical protein